ncbi:MAG: fructosamine kinase family protein, partial [Anaerolineales bacterium]|nr:fructosamine kinase family protein [Anaerolineales bacterium]
MPSYGSIIRIMLGAVDFEIEKALGRAPTSFRHLSGGSVAEVYRATVPDIGDVVAKVDRSKRPTLDIEGYMLEYLAAHSTLPVPKVFHAAPELLIMEMLPGVSHFSSNAQIHAAELLAELHGIRADRFGLERDTLIGSLHQPNAFKESWGQFFGEHRLLYMAREAHGSGRMGKKLLGRLEAVAGRLDDWIEGPEHPSLLHGDVWTTNVLADVNHITGFIDPAVYFGHPEIELAFIALFSTFGSAFFNRYNELRPIAPGFFEERRDIYNLYPLLVHVRLFGGSYVERVESTLDKFG